jgi:hypothetical protein
VLDSSPPGLPHTVWLPHTVSRDVDARVGEMTEEVEARCLAASRAMAEANGNRACIPRSSDSMRKTCACASSHACLVQACVLPVTRVLLEICHPVKRTAHCHRQNLCGDAVGLDQGPAGGDGRVDARGDAQGGVADFMGKDRLRRPRETSAVSTCLSPLISRTHARKMLTGIQIDTGSR